MPSTSSKPSRPSGGSAHYGGPASSTSTIQHPQRPLSLGKTHRPHSTYDASSFSTPADSAAATSPQMQFFVSNSPPSQRPLSTASNSVTNHTPPVASPVIALPPNPARVRGQRASLPAANAGAAPRPAGDSTLRPERDREKPRAQAKSAQLEQEERAREQALQLPGDEIDEFGLPIRRRPRPVVHDDQGSDDGRSEQERADEAELKLKAVKRQVEKEVAEAKDLAASRGAGDQDNAQDSDAAFESAEENQEGIKTHTTKGKPVRNGHGKTVSFDESGLASRNANERPSTPDPTTAAVPEQQTPAQLKKAREEHLAHMFETTLRSDKVDGVSAVSHQALAIQAQQEKQTPAAPVEDEWQQMRAYGKDDVYNDDGQIIAAGIDSDDEDQDGVGGGARKGYTKLTFDEDAESQTSMDENTNYLFSERSRNLLEEDEEARNPLQQMQATKDLLTEGQRIAYVGLTRLSIAAMVKDLDVPDVNKKIKKDLTTAVDAMKMWGQKMMVRLYAHMDIESSEQIMIEQLTDHGVQPGDLTPLLMQNARVKNPMAEKGSETKSPTTTSGRPSQSESQTSADSADDEDNAPPPYKEHMDDELTVQSPSMLPATKNIDIDIRWTVLCDLFLVLIADSIYDARSRRLLEKVGEKLEVSWMDICRFEKRVTDALEMEEEANQENWDEKGNVELRRKRALKRRYVMMGLATVGGGLVIGLSAGLLAPVIGAGLGAGFTAIGVTGTTSFMAGVGGAAIITSASATAGGIIAVRATNRRTGAVKTFEYRPLHNNKRVNLIVTVSGWMNGRVDDVRLPFSTVDPVMGDIYSLLWEPDVLQSTGDTIRILATEALTQGLQQVLAATFLTTLMAGLSLPLILSKLSYLIDNPWSVSLDRADAAGLILADSLVERNLGVRPITLVGFSLGARVIFSCLRELANKGAYGLVHNVYLFGSPITASTDDYLRASTVISGRFVNGYATNDWIIGYLFRATSGGISRVAGLAKVEGVPGIENVDVTSIVNGHMAYRAAMPRLLRQIGWEVESDEFVEIEDPDPDNHERRQRELIREIDSARQEQENQEAKGRWANFWQRKKEKKGWETYDVNASLNGASDKDKSRRADEDPNANILFDIEAIRRELESEQLEVRQLESTLPPMRLDLSRSQTEPSGISTGGSSGAGSPANATSPSKNQGPRRSSSVWRDLIKSPSLGSGRARQGSKSSDSGGGWAGFSHQSKSSTSKASLPDNAKSTGLGAVPGSTAGASAQPMSWDYDEAEDGHLASPGGAPDGPGQAQTPTIDAVLLPAPTQQHEHEREKEPQRADAARGADSAAARSGQAPQETGWDQHAHLRGTMPGLGLDQNAWAEDEHDFGEPGPGEIKMTFE